MKVAPEAVLRVLEGGQLTSQQIAESLGLASAMNITARLKSMEREGLVRRTENKNWEKGSCSPSTPGFVPAKGVRKVTDLKGWKLKYVWLRHGKSDERVDVVTDPETGDIYTTVTPDSYCTIVVGWASGFETGLRRVDRSWPLGQTIMNKLEGN